MKPLKKIPSLHHSTKIVTAVLMCFCLLFLTGVNFIVFPQQETDTITSLVTPGKQTDKDPSAPVEEKSSSSNSLSVQEEYLHERHTLHEIIGTAVLLQHKNLIMEKLQTVHFELISPPPDA
ncbi:MAG: hypothetical protein ABI741_00150 [Ferruginibacter sp.]